MGLTVLLVRFHARRGAPTGTRGLIRKVAPGMPQKYRKFSPEFREEAVRLVIENSRPIARVARELGVSDGTLGNWVNQYRNEHADEEPPLTPTERIQLAETQREIRELRMENEFLNYAEDRVMPMFR